MGVVEVVTDDGYRLWTHRSGSGLPLVLCHGGPGIWDYFEPVAALLDHAVSVVRWDQRGCGRGERRGPYAVARSVADLETLRQHLRAPRIALLGHSWGAHLALEYALVHPERVNRLIYVSGTGVDPDHTWKSGFHRNFQRCLGDDTHRWTQLEERDRTPAEDRELAILQWTTDFVDPATARQHAERLATPWLGLNWECAEALNAETTRSLHDTDWAARCRALPVQTLIVDGEHDLRPRWAVDSLERALPHVQRITLARAGHNPWADDAEAFSRTVAGFLTAPASV